MTTSVLSSDRIGRRFQSLAEENRPGFIPYITAGYPSLDATKDLMQGLADVGADVIELGVPFSDPVADGPTIQRSSQGALDRGTTVDHVFRLLSDFRSKSDVPVVLFSYLNPIYARGAETFMGEAVEAGADGLLATDLPVGVDPELETVLEEGPLDLIRLIAPTTQAARISVIANRSQGFLYYISRTGVTGTGLSLSESLAVDVGAIRKVSPCPVAVGFGISTPEHAAVVGACSDAAIVGSALIDALDAGGVKVALELSTSLRHALDSARMGKTLWQHQTTSAPQNRH